MHALAGKYCHPMQIHYLLFPLCPQTQTASTTMRMRKATSTARSAPSVTQFSPAGSFLQRRVWQPLSFKYNCANIPSQGRYHLYVALGCPWAHRSLIARRLKGLEDFIGPFLFFIFHLCKLAKLTLQTSLLSTPTYTKADGTLSPLKPPPTLLPSPSTRIPLSPVRLKIISLVSPTFPKSTTRPIPTTMPVSQSLSSGTK